MTTETALPASQGSALARRAAELARAGFDRSGENRAAFRSDPVWALLRELGTDLWLDTGDLDEARSLWTAEFSSLTTNNTLVNKEVQKGTFDDVVPRTGQALREAAPGIDPETLLYEVGFILNCRVALRLVAALDARVSVELHPAMADDAAASVTYGRRYFAVCPERFIIKVPLTAAGFLAARQLGAEGIPVNYTLGFSARQNLLVARFSRPDFVNVFMGRLNAFVADNDLGSGEFVGEKATRASQRVVRDLRARGLAPSRQIGASMRSAEQLYALAGLDVFTMPTAVAREFHRQMSEGPRRLTPAIDEALAIELNPGIDERGVGLHHLWEITPVVTAAAETLAKWNPSGQDGDAFARAARDAGLADLFPAWTEADRRRVERDGKIPRYPAWADRLRSGEVGLDALMSLSALYSFVTDQRQLDERIRGLLGQAGLL